MKRRFFAFFTALCLLPVLAWGQAPCSPGSPAGPSASTANAAGGGFTTRNGQIYGPNGQPFQARGVDVLWGGNVPSADTLTLSGVNFVRLAVYNYASPAELSSYVNSLTSKGVVVELEDHNNNAGNAGGGQGQIFTGQALATENNWYQQVGTAFATNPDVWFGTPNEPSETNANGQQDPAALSQWQLSNYNAIRGTGNNNPILLEINGWPNNGQPQMAVGYTPSVYAGMTNVVGDIHYYGWLTNGSTDQATNSNFLAQMIQQTQQALPTASGAMPIIVGEYGPSTTGQDPVDPNSRQVIDAVQSSGVGNVAWAWMTGTDGQDALLSSSGGLTDYGQEVLAYIKAAASACPGTPVIASTPPGAGPVIANSTPIVPVPAIGALSASPPVDTDPIDTAAANSGGQSADPGAIAEPMGPLPSTAGASPGPVVSALATSGTTEQVVPTYGTDGSVSGAATAVAAVAAVPSSSSSPSADPIFAAASGLPEQVVPKYGAGGTTGVMPSSPTSSLPPIDGINTTPASAPGDTPQLETLLAQPYGQTAVSTADQLGVNPASEAAIAQVENGFRNIPTANGSTLATGPWQFTPGTFAAVSQSNNLGFSASDLTNPTAQATEAAYYLQQIASGIGVATGQPATTLQAYGGWVFGPDAGAQIANASDSTPLSALVRAQSLANNGMSSWTVGDFRTAMTTRLGPAANQTVLTTQGI